MILDRESRGKLAVLLALLVLGACAEHEQTFSGTTMGTTYSVVLRGKELSPNDAETLHRAIQAELDRLESIFSTYRSDSEISRLNSRYRPDRPYRVSNEMAEVLHIAARVKAATGGAFSPLVGSLVDYWGFGPEKSADKSVSQTSPAVLGCASRAEFSLLPTKGSQKGTSLVITKAPTRTCAGQKPKLDLSAIAKGYAVDRLSELLMQRGFSNYLVEIGGEICVRNTAGGAAWLLGIEDPRGSPSLAQAMEIHSSCLATSGNSRQMRTVGSRRVTHIIDPLTGEALERNASSVSVIAPTAAEADAWATGLFVLGQPKAIELAAAQSMAVMYLEEAAGRVQKSTTPAWPQK
jgi:thiamine biosynthesis lipoprotein